MSQLRWERKGRAEPVGAREWCIFFFFWKMHKNQKTLPEFARPCHGFQKSFPQKMAPLQRISKMHSGLRKGPQAKLA